MSEKVPDVLQSNYPTANLVRHEIWNRLHRDNEHYMAGVFGREGKGKSGTAIAIAEMIDPRMSVEQILFDPQAMLKKISEWKKAGTTKGRMIVADESGVGMGNRTWYEKDQIQFAQILQLIRSENMGILFTVPRGVEMDSQIRGGRLHAQIIVRVKHEGDYVEAEYERIRVGRRVDNDGLWTPKPSMEIDGVTQRLTTIRIGPPSSELWDSYIEKKNEFQQEAYEDAASSNEDDGEGSNEIKRVVRDILDGDTAYYITEHGGTGKPMVNGDIIGVKYNLSRRDAKAAKAMVKNQLSDEELEKYA